MKKLNRVKTSDGQLHQSQKSANRWEQLKLMQSEGKISNLRRNVKYVLIPAQYIENNNLMGKRFKLIERECSYIADFVYNQDGKTVVEDVNSRKKSGVFIIKRKLMLHIYKIKIQEF